MPEVSKRQSGAKTVLTPRVANRPIELASKKQSERDSYSVVLFLSDTIFFKFMKLSDEKNSFYFDA